MQIRGVIAKAAFVVAFLAVAPILRAQDTVSISDPAEFNAYSAAVSQNDPKTKVAGLEHFLTAYPQSVVKNSVLDTLLSTYTSMGDSTDALNAAARMLQVDPNNLKAIYVSVFIWKGQCEKNHDAQSCNNAAALAQKGLAASKGANISDTDWDRRMAAVYPLFRSTLALVGTTEQAAQGKLSAPSSQPAIVQQSRTSGAAPQQGVIAVGKLISEVNPIYPPIAKAANVQGTVAIHAVIGKDGTVNSPTVVSGPPLLQQAAIDAVKQWKYRPYTLDGAPVEVETTLNIVFALDGTARPQPSQAAAQPIAESSHSVSAGVTSAAPTQPVPDEKEPEAQYDLALEYYKGTNGKLKDANQAAYWFRKSAERGNPMAQYSLGVMYNDGLGGLPKDEPQAVLWYQKAADNGVGQAQFYLAQMYLVGRGDLPKDDGLAVQLMQKAAEKGVLKAQARLANIYAAGNFGVQQDFVKAAYWLGKAAAQGDAESEFNIGLFYETSRGGFPVDIQTAAEWYNKAAEQGNKDARAAMSRLKSQVGARSSQPSQSMCLGGKSEQIAYCKKWATDAEHINAYCLASTWSPYGGGGLVAYCTKVLTESFGDCNGNESEAGYCRVAATRDEAEVASRLLSAENEQQKRIDDFVSMLCTASDQRTQAEQRIDQNCIEKQRREAAEVQRKENERRVREERVAADKASAGKHTTRYRGMYIGELFEDAPIKQSGCSTDDWSGPALALEKIGEGKSISECVVLISTNDDKAIYRILVFTRTPFSQEYQEFVGKYGSPLPGRYSLVDGDVPNAVAWQTKDGTQIAVKPDTLRERDNPAHAVPYAIIVYSSR